VEPDIDDGWVTYTGAKAAQSVGADRGKDIHARVRE